MKAKEIADHFFSIADWVDRDNTVDGIILGDPEKDIKKILVTWISSFDCLKDAVDRQVDMLVTHEPTFYHHRREREMMENWDIAREKKRFIEEHGLVILRNHDIWDKMPNIGIPWALAQYLELGDTPAKISEDCYQHRYDIEPIAFDEFAKRVAAKTALIGEPFVQVFGQANTNISHVGIGTGCFCRTDVSREMGCDVSIVCDDGTAYWEQLQRCHDVNHPFIRINHGTSEDPGMVTLTKYINEHFPGVTAEHWRYPGSYRLIGE